MSQKLIKTSDGWVSCKAIKYRCSGLGCKEMPIKSVWIKAESMIDKTKKYKSLINVCQKHYEKEKSVGAIIEENGKPVKADY